MSNHRQPSKRVGDFNVLIVVHEYLEQNNQIIEFPEQITDVLKLITSVYKQRQGNVAPKIKSTLLYCYSICSDNLKHSLRKDSSLHYKFDPECEHFSNSPYALRRGRQAKVFNEDDSDEESHEPLSPEQIKQMCTDSRGMYIPGNDDLLILGFKLPKNNWKIDPIQPNYEIPAGVVL